MRLSGKWLSCTFSAHGISVWIVPKIILKILADGPYFSDSAYVNNSISEKMLAVLFFLMIETDRQLFLHYYYGLTAGGFTCVIVGIYGSSKDYVEY